MSAGVGRASGVGRVCWQDGVRRFWDKSETLSPCHKVCHKIVLPHGTRVGILSENDDRAVFMPGE